MGKNFEDFKFFLNQLSYNFSFICLTETWCKETLDKNSLYHLPNYSVVYQNRSHKDKGGGVCIYVHNSIKFKVRNDLSSNTSDLECLSIEVEQNKSKNFVVSTMYRPPRGNINEFLSKLKTNFEACSNKPIYTFGDFNINVLKYNTSKSVKNFVDLIFEYGSLPTINKPTRITRKNSTAIDNIITNSFLNNNLEAGIIETDISDHFPVILIDNQNYIIESSFKNEPKKVFKRSFNQDNLTKFKMKLLDYEWSFLYSFKDADQAYDYFSRIFYKLYNEIFPKKEVLIKKKKSIPWITRGLIKSSKRKQRLYENFLRHKTVKNEKKYKTYRNNFNKVLKFAKRLYVSDLLMKYRNDIKKTWRTVNELIGRKSVCADYFPKTIRHKNREIHSKQDIADIFNDFFTSIGSDLARKIPQNNVLYTSFLNIVDTEMKMYDVTDEETKKAFHSLKSNKSAGFDEISPKVVKSVASEIFKPLKFVTNLSIRKGIVPQKLKIARVIPVHKMVKKR